MGSAQHAHKFIEQITRVVWSGAGFRVILHTERLVVFQANSLYRLVVQIDVCSAHE